MNKILLQIWEESERGWGVRPDGCSIHLSHEDRDKFVEDIYLSRDIHNVPDEYDRVIGSPIEVFVSDGLFNELKLNRSLRVLQHQMNNLINLEEIIIKP